jgi:hypothetical protein
MRVELNENDAKHRLGTAVPVEAVAAQMGQIDKTSRLIQTGLVELKGAVDALLGVNREILEQMRENTVRLAAVAEGMAGTVELLGKLLQASEMLHLELSESARLLRERITQGSRF